MSLRLAIAALVVLMAVGCAAGGPDKKECQPSDSPTGEAESIALSKAKLAVADACTLESARCSFSISRVKDKSILIGVAFFHSYPEMECVIAGSGISEFLYDSDGTFVRSADNGSSAEQPVE